MYLTYSICLSGIQEESNAELQILTEVMQIKSNTKGLRILKGQFQAISCLTVTLSRRLLVIKYNEKKNLQFSTICQCKVKLAYLANTNFTYQSMLNLRA